MKIEVHRLRVNVKSLANEARLIRSEIRRAHDPDAKAYLACHRSRRLKPEARMAHLALAYCKGVPYRVVEQNAKSKPSYEQLLNKIRRFRFNEEGASVAKWIDSE